VDDNGKHSSLLRYGNHYSFIVQTNGFNRLFTKYLKIRGQC
jgi:hypothetical protein